MSELKKVKAVQDSDCHWYVIPAEMLDEFYKLLEGNESTEDEFIDKFEKFRTGGDLNLVTLYAYLDF